VLSGDVNNPTRTKLKMNKAVTIKTGGCGGKTTTTTEQQQQQQSTTQETSEPPETTTTTTTEMAENSQQRGFFQKIWHGLASAVNGVVSFFRGLF
jgi:hypothetical protein